MHLLAVTVLSVLSIERSCAKGHFSRQHVDATTTDLPKAKCQKQCEAPDENIKCVANQERQEFYQRLDEHCTCLQYRCVWTTCPIQNHVTCGECEEKVNYEDCGCRMIKCEEKKKHCDPPKIDCGPCDKVEHKMDKCECPEYKCSKQILPIQSQCDCTDCEDCVTIGTCGLKVCKPRLCALIDKSKCDDECETTEVDNTDKCCPTFRCKPKDQPAQCDSNCYEPMTTFSEKCGFDKTECARKACEQPADPKCYETIGEDECNCPIYVKKQCTSVPVTYCPEGTAREYGDDGCGCTTSVCVLCSKLFPEPPCPQGVLESEIDPDTRCEVKRCVIPHPPIPCPPTVKSCPKCHKLQKVGTYGHCTIQGCVPIFEPACICKHVEDCPDECETPGNQTRGLCVGYKTCVKKPAYQCPTPIDTCNECQKAELVKGKCGCYEYQCVEKECKGLTEDEEKEKLEQNQCEKGYTASMGTDKCNCPVSTCVKDERIWRKCWDWGYRYANGTRVVEEFMGPKGQKVPK